MKYLLIGISLLTQTFQGSLKLQVMTSLGILILDGMSIKMCQGLMRKQQPTNLSGPKTTRCYGRTQPIAGSCNPQGQVAEPGQPWLHLPPEAPSGWSTVSTVTGAGEERVECCSPAFQCFIWPYHVTSTCISLGKATQLGHA